MNINQNLTSYHQLSNFQKQFTQFEKAYSDRMKETDSIKNLFQTLKDSLSEEEQKNYTYDNFTYGFVISDPDIISSGVFPRLGDVPEYTYKDQDKESNDLTLTEGFSFKAIKDSTLSITNRGVIVEYGEERLTENDCINLNKMSSLLDRFIRYANDQGGKRYDGLGDSKIIAGMFQKLGVDISKPFVINGVEFTYNPIKGLDKAVVTNDRMRWCSTSVLKQQANYFINKYDMDFTWDDDKLVDLLMKK